MENFKKDFSDYILGSNKIGSNKASSYIKALDIIDKILSIKPLGFSDCQNIWRVNSINKLIVLYEFTKDQSRKFESSEWNLDCVPPSYLRNGFISAALKFYIDYHSKQSFNTLSVEDLLD